MKTYETLGVYVIFLSAVLVNTGCQSTPQQSSSAEPKIDNLVQETEQPATVVVEKVAREEKKPEKVQKETDTSGDVPIVTVKNAVHDFGQVGPTSSNKCEFTFTNTGKAILKIQRIQSTCGCTVPELEKKEYAPGEVGTIKVRCKAPSTKGKVSKHLYIISNDPKTPRAELEIKCEVVVKVSISPENIDLRLDKDNAGMGDIVVKSLDNREFSIKSIIIPNEVMKIAFDPAKKAKEHVLKSVIDVEKLNKYPTGVLQIKTDHPQSGSQMVRYAAKPRYEVSRPRIILQNVEPGKLVEKEVLILSNYDEPVEIASFESKNGYMEIKEQVKDGPGLKLSIAITPPLKTATARRYITDELTITLKDETKLSIRCSGWFRLK